ncbi:hypothetical protein K493DRAFT_315182 [Basidiobolus meristosporus CBS 931.73]|uniref:Uncharacterized protein n=1 Tax=Basidiobolus meristosporus CBS 931.73 TaxID=1314790 RepID=A0A1Y1YAQ1_9FUNG|nr:hypothetical protein K493DRAFT_315182 [Basidiobolus meristosporus CBS 931.73]|eukprot:ORX95090.1 hypothetical protein K493DRAFT_315182 [Basidiobolus meristosporus CBS 931.73]
MDHTNVPGFTPGQGVPREELDPQLIQQERNQHNLIHDEHHVRKEKSVNSAHSHEPNHPHLSAIKEKVKGLFHKEAHEEGRYGTADSHSNAPQLSGAAGATTIPETSSGSGSLINDKPDSRDSTHGVSRQNIAHEHPSDPNQASPQRVHNNPNNHAGNPEQRHMAGHISNYNVNPDGQGVFEGAYPATVDSKPTAAHDNNHIHDNNNPLPARSAASETASDPNSVFQGAYPATRDHAIPNVQSTVQSSNIAAGNVNTKGNQPQYAAYDHGEATY